MILTAEGDGRAVLLADFSGTQMASESFVTCLDLADANAHEAREALGMSAANRSSGVWRAQDREPDCQSRAFVWCRIKRARCYLCG